MAVCEICGKKTVFGNSVSFAGNRVNRTRRPNLQRATVLRQGRRVQLTICTRCLKAGKLAQAE